MVAHQSPVGRVIRQRGAAPGTLRHVAAFTAQQHPAAATAIQKEDALLLSFNILFKFPPEVRSNKAGVSSFYLLAKIGNQDLRKILFVIAAVQSRFIIQPLFRRPGGFNRRGGGAKDQ